MPAPYFDPSVLGGAASYVTSWIRDQVGYDVGIDPTLPPGTSGIVDDKAERITVGVCCEALFHSRAGRAALNVIGLRRGELWFPEFIAEPHLRLIEGGA